jgi:hypothetical protein
MPKRYDVKQGYTDKRNNREDHVEDFGYKIKNIDRSHRKKVTRIRKDRDN